MIYQFFTGIFAIFSQTRKYYLTFWHENVPLLESEKKFVSYADFERVM